MIVRAQQSVVEIKSVAVLVRSKAQLEEARVKLKGISSGLNDEEVNALPWGTNFVYWTPIKITIKDYPLITNLAILNHTAKMEYGNASRTRKCSTKYPKHYPHHRRSHQCFYESKCAEH